MHSGNGSGYNENGMDSQRSPDELAEIDRQHRERGRGSKLFGVIGHFFAGVIYLWVAGVILSLLGLVYLFF